jgi:putative transcriptional regulator
MRARNRGEQVPLVRNAARPVPRVSTGRALDVPDQVSQAGSVLIAGPTVGDPELRGATIAILVHSPKAGALGVRLDRRTSRSALDVFDEPSPEVVDTAAVFDGGPVRDVVIVLAAPRPDAPWPPGYRPVRGDVGTLPVPVRPAEAEGIAATCVFAGYLGWRPGQLEDELASGELIASKTTLDSWFWQQHSGPRDRT